MASITGPLLLGRKPWQFNLPTLDTLLHVCMPCRVGYMGTILLCVCCVDFEIIKMYALQSYT